MKTFIATIINAPYKITEIDGLNRVTSEWKNITAPIELEIWSEKAAAILFFGDESRQIDHSKNLENFFIFQKDSFLIAAGFQKKYDLAREIGKLAITHIAIKRDFCEVSFNPDDEFSLDDLKMLAHLEFNVSMDLIDNVTVMELFTVNNFTITEKNRNIYTVSRPK